MKHEKFKPQTIKSKVNFNANPHGVRIIGNNKKIARAFKDFGWTRDQSINVDGGAKIDVTMTPYFSIYLELRHPFVSGFTLEANEREVPINNIPSVAIGATINILADYGTPQDDVLMIIQEPISIPVVEIKIEEPKEPEEAVVVPEIIIEPEALPEDESEDLGWFAWIIEFIAKLFRF